MRLALEDIRVLDLSTAWAGPMTGLILAAMGAEVIKIESCQRYDFTRIVHVAGNKKDGERPWNKGAVFNTLNRNKLGLTLDLTKPRGVDIFKRLVKISDVVLENFTPRVMQKFGLDYSVLSELNPRIVMMSESGYGQNGAYRDFLAYGLTIDPTAGAAWLTGYADSKPTILPVVYGDTIAGMTSALAILFALRFRDKTGEGQHLDIAMREAIACLFGPVLMDYTTNDRIQARTGNQHCWMSPHGIYRCNGEDKWVAIAVSSDEEWQGLCRAMGNPEWAKEVRFSDTMNRWQNQSELDRLVEQWTSSKDRYDVMEQLQKEGVAAGAVQNAKDLLRNAHLNDRGFFKVADDPEVGKRVYPRVYTKLSKMPPADDRPAPVLGEHNDYILGELLEMSQDKIAELEKEGIIGNAPIPTPRPVLRDLAFYQELGWLSEYDLDPMKSLGFEEV